MRFINRSSEVMPAFACGMLPLVDKSEQPVETVDHEDNGIRVLDVYKPDRVIEARQDPEFIVFNGPQAVPAGKRGLCTQHWPVLGAVAATAGEIEVGSCLGPVADEWFLRWGTAFFSQGHEFPIVTSENLAWCFPTRLAYRGPAIQCYTASADVASGENVPLNSIYSASAPGPVGSPGTQPVYNFANSVNVSNNEFAVPRRGLYLIGFTARATATVTSGQEIYATVRVYVHANGITHQTPLLAPGYITRISHSAGEDRAYAHLFLSGQLPLRHGWTVSLCNTTAQALTLSKISVSMIHVSSVRAHEEVPWEDELWM